MGNGTIVKTWVIGRWWQMPPYTRSWTWGDSLSPKHLLGIDREPGGGGGESKTVNAQNRRKKENKNEFKRSLWTFGRYKVRYPYMYIVHMLVE